MQLGFTTTEEVRYRDGQLTNGSLADYKIPTLLDMPREFVNAWPRSVQHDGPFGGGVKQVLEARVACCQRRNAHCS